MSQPTNNTINLPHTEIVLRDDGIVQVTGTDYDYTVKEIRECFNAIRQLTGNRKYRLLGIGTQFGYVDENARKFLSSSEANENVIAKAYVMKSIGHAAIFNFVVKVYGMPVPFRLFHKTEHAEKWLKQDRFFEPIEE